MSKNKFEIYGDKILISHPNWDFIASATIRDDYAEELQSVTWTKVGEYLYSNKLEKYLHIYIMVLCQDLVQIKMRGSAS